MMESTKKGLPEEVMEKKLNDIQQFEVEMLEHVRSLRDIEGRGTSDVERMYEGAVVFVTGGTGFLGKQLVEKLLRSCPGIRKIYLLSRSKRGRDLYQRWDKIVQEPVFDELRRRCPDFRQRLLPIEGDIATQRLGIKDEDWKLLSEEVNFIFHVAATVRFNEPLKVAINTNVRATREAVTLARACRNLRCLTHVSTAYAHCNRTDIKEQFYDSPVPPQAMIELVDSLAEEKLAAITDDLIKGWPNTYTFSKALAEEIIRTMCQDLPVCVVRPAVVVPAYQEPTPGWLDMTTIIGPSGSLLATYMGISRVSLADANAETNFVPVDYVNNLTIVASWDTVQRRSKGEKDIRIYTLSRQRKPENFKQLLLHTEKSKMWKFFPPNALWYPKSRMVRNVYLYWIAVFFLHWIPSLIIDPLLEMAGSKLRLAPTHKKLQKNATTVSFFGYRSWHQFDDNTLQLYQTISKTDQQIFKFNISDIDLPKFTRAWCLGIRKFILRDGLKTTKQDERKMYWFYWFNKFDILILILYAYGLFKVFFLFFAVLTYFFMWFSQIIDLL